MAEAQAALAAFCTAQGFRPGVANRIEVIFEELVSNAIRHGGARLVRVRVTPSEGRVELLFEDDGTPFNPLEPPPRRKPASLAEARPGGLGVPLVLSLSEDLSYERCKGQGAVNRTAVKVSTAT